MEILKLFGIDWKLMLAQLVNFAVVIAVLWFFALKPLTKMMRERNKEIEKGLDDARQAEARLTEVEKLVNDKIKETKFDADIILNEARKEAEKAKSAAAEKTKKEIEAMIEKAKKQLASEKRAMISEVKGEVGEMIVRALEKILSRGLTKEMDKKYIDQTLKELK
ncbi:ATP synthase F0 subunit B [Candidatus Kuenenbacteria bacterium CG_4_9_14_3_um_filter_39_14]|uniref:ATP synthase subunit b n=7 Tax=Candidatus Kueneniibacteriota TaxID=1752740 RepID=A0A2M7IKZ3_9BACT|nr:F0F1 ATP synthase subunit B [Candidatus Kuenenbacteria bacterium]OIP56698.1 MAG: ATP synthase F0 subunit B [Candidatus Kuenenbacteria bacterium CG2_30_39_24]PIP28699.1 MAG: ATP synthase F0 subunit B [Candidatus Kuenenbacteria bacterium CG23_combo_of_CG06-09_8_20_14_all_39_39]PIP75531.1 MAG: ATP synthase F0 subunit B [Candidatus Kuenenbacteria bacterium CG22_combo_CG10-13_8_21_14_all_39_9]PIR80511.1 MAG: ATP synthase F0 subunit B [Candidatus Kuenenbacteria bacterium CG10_big_fil_rev_8_21_14_0